MGNPSRIRQKVRGRVEHKVILDACFEDGLTKYCVVSEVRFLRAKALEYFGFASLAAQSFDPMILLGMRSG